METMEAESQEESQPRQDQQQTQSNPMMMSNNQPDTCDERIRKTIKKFQQDNLAEKERIQRVNVEICQKEKQQLTNQLTQKYTLDLSYFKQDMIQQYREEKEISDRKIRLQAHMEREDLRKELLLKYRKEVEDVKIEYEKKYFIQLQDAKEEILHNITLEIGENDQEKVLNYLEKNKQMLMNQQQNEELENLRQENIVLRNRTCPEFLPSSTSSPSFARIQPAEFQLDQDQMVKIGFFSLGIFFLFVFGWFMSLGKEKRSDNSSDSFELPPDQPVNVIETSITTPSKSGPALISPTSPRSAGNQPFPSPVQEIALETSTITVPNQPAPSPRQQQQQQQPLGSYDIYFSFANASSSSSSIPFDYYHRIAQELENTFGCSVFCPENKQEILQKEQILDLLDQAKCVLFFVTPEYQAAINDHSHSMLDSILTRIELNYSLGCLSAGNMIPIIATESMIKKQSWKGRLRHDFYQSKSVSFFPGQMENEKEFKQKIQEIITRIKAVM